VTSGSAALDGPGHRRGRICFVSAEHPALDKRVFQKEALSLARAGFDVSHLCPGPAEGVERVQGVEIISYRRRRGKLGRALGLARLFAMARRVDADIYHCNEPDSWLIGVLMRALHRRVAVFDCHEHYPGQVVRWLPRGTRVIGARLMRLYLQLMGLVTDVVVLAKYSIASDLSWSRRRHLVILNTAPLAALTAAGGAPPASPRRAAFTFVHVGVFRRERGSEELLAAMRELARRGRRDYRVVLIGEFKDGSEQDFHDKARAAGLADLIESHPWLAFDEAFALVRQCHAGLVLFQKSLMNNVYGMPHKMFDYMLAGLPVIAPDFAPDIVRVLQESGGGILVDAGDPAALADVFVKLIDDRALADEIGARGQQAVLTRYNWEAEAEKLVEAYARLLGERPAVSGAAR
jgi:glycosyltransferase involved in cell wall biosynthesis